MKKNFKLSLIILLLLTSLNSCFQEYLDPLPETALAEEFAFDTRTRIIAQVNALYIPVKSGQYLGGRYQIYNDIRANDFVNRRSNGVTGLATWEHTVLASTNEVQNLWVQIYSAINSANIFLAGMEANKSKIVPALLNQAEFDQFKGEALALRGMAYFHLSQLYSRPYNQSQSSPGMVLRLTAMKDTSENGKARSTVAQTYTQILSDLNTAKSLMPTTAPSSAVVRVTRLNRNSVIALLTKVHLHKSDWASVKAEGDILVTQSARPFSGPWNVALVTAPTALHSAFESVFRSPYTTAESMFSIPMTDTELPGTQNQLGHYYSGTTGVGNMEYSINQTSPNWQNTEILPDDARRKLTVNRTAAPAGLYINKFTVFPHTDWAPVIRYAEVLLNLAEAEARLVWPNARAVELLNAVYLRSAPAGTAAYTVSSFATANDFVARLLRERNMEFMGEGMRNMDIMRQVIPIPKGGGGTVPVSSADYTWPIPVNELSTNKLVIQNGPL